MATLAAYTRLDRVGRGSYGEVFKVRRHSDGTELVLKEVSMVSMSEQEEREILNETSCMMALSHPHIIAYVGSFLERGSLHIVMEFASGGDLQCLIRRHVQASTFLSEERLWKFLIQLTQGLQHAHTRRILHRDIKASNVFLDAHDNIKIGDLGLAPSAALVLALFLALVLARSRSLPPFRSRDQRVGCVCIPYLW